MNIAILVDQAGGEELNKKKKKLSDWTAILVIGLGSDNNYYLLDAVRDRLNPTDRIETIFMMHRKWNQLTGKPPKVGCEQIGLMTDTHYLKEKQKQETYHFPVIPLGAGQRISKEERIRKLIPIMEAGRWYVPGNLLYVDTEGRRWDLTREFIDVELKTFPKSRYDDIIDCASRILDAELCMTFPKPKVGTVAKARMQAQQVEDNWESW
jgi:predicted phage terminase large subunit-like protein